MMNWMDRFRKIINEKFYVIGFLPQGAIDHDNSSKSFFEKIRWVDTQRYKGGWFADPFILYKDDNQIEVLAEEKVYKLGRGRLVKLIIDAKTYKLLSLKVILQLETHLSFPYIIRDGGKIYVCPENRKSGVLSIYEYDPKIEELVNRRVMIPEPLVDPQVIKLDGRYYLFAVNQEDGQAFDANLRIYVSDNLLEGYKLLQNLIVADRVKRGAGAIIEMDGKLIRPSQDCRKSYGGAVILNELQFNGGQFTETPVSTIAPIWDMKYGKGLHTFNVCDGLCVVDGIEYRHQALHLFINMLKRS